MPQRILVVEDHARFRALICSALQKQADFQIIEAADGLEGVQKAADLQPDLILLDINLPKMHGFEVAKQIYRLAPNARILFMSQESSPELVRKALSLGAHGYIQKMSAATDLTPAIEAALAGRRFVSPGVAFAEPVTAPVSRRHEILFCPNEAEIVGRFARHVEATLNADDAAIMLVTESHRIELLQALRTRGVNVDGAIARGTCVSFDADLALDLVAFGQAIDGARAAAVKAGKTNPRVACCGERAGRLWTEGRTEEALQLEQLCRRLPPDVDVLCVYPMPYTTDDQNLAYICAEHTAVSAC
jgi:DNA-binding NarL/FixJ family response regulator